MICKYAEIFCWKNVSSFCNAKATHIFSAKNIRILCFESAKTVNKMTPNELIKLTTLWTTGPRWLQIYVCYFACVLWWLIRPILALNCLLLGKNFSRHQTDDNFLIFSRKQDLTLHANYLLRRQFVRNIRAYFRGKMRKMFQNGVCWIFYPPY